MMEIMPGPKEIVARQEELSIPAGAACVLISDERARFPAGLIAEPLKAQVAREERLEGVHVRVNLVKELDFARALRSDQRVEAYRLEVSKAGVELSALTAEGLLRGAATLLQMTRLEKGVATTPCAAVNDWPNFRHRCAADWLVNVECNRWAYDRGDGAAAFLARIKRKLDFCFAHKINMVWFDGFGWDTERFPGYAPLLKECNRHARRLGIKLVSAGYGGGYGTSYQAGEIYRYGYFGKVYLNKRPYPDGEEYACCGWPASPSRRYGTCPSNEQLRAAKLEEMKRFVREVNPGFMYIHDIDGDAWLPVKETWKQRCGECRRRWPSDELADADGHAGAYSSWFKQVRQELSALPASGDYSPARDLVLIFTSPLYTSYHEPEDVWDLEMRYFDSLSRLIGPERGIEFGLREQFFTTGNRKKIGALRELLDKNGNGHGIHVISFGGGDNYISDDLTNISGAMAHFFDGAESVCLSNGGMHQEPIQALNADFLWSGTAGGHRENPANEAEAVAVFEKIASGSHKPAAIFEAGGVFDQTCSRLWGRDAGQFMSKALQAKMPVSHVWWSITKTVAALKNDATHTPANMEKDYAERELATASALEQARQAAAISDDEDIHWFVKCLEVGKQFAGAVKWLAALKAGKDEAAGERLSLALKELEAYIGDKIALERTDILGGDPGCWLETITEMRKVSESLLERRNSGS